KAAGGAVLPFTDVGYSCTSLWVGPGARPFLDEDYYDGGFGWTVCHAINALVVAEDDPNIAPLLGLRWAYLHPRISAEAGLPVAGTTWYAEVLAQCHRLRDMVGNPFRPVAFNSSWQTATVVALAQAIYDERHFTDIPILADALEDAGCANPDIL